MQLAINVHFLHSRMFLMNLILICSGEKTSVKEWPGSIEIKGRVRLDAFEKFLQHLPMSRSRAVMVSQVSSHCTRVQLCYFCLKKGDGFLCLNNNLPLSLMQQCYRVFGIVLNHLCRRLKLTSMNVWPCVEKTVNRIEINRSENDLSLFLNL